MAVKTRVLVTRPAGQADALLRSLAELDLTAVHLPMLSVEAIDPLASQDRQCVLDLDRYDHAIFVSANAANLGMTCIENYWPQLPDGLRYWAVGVSTARALEPFHLTACYPETNMSSEGLLELLASEDMTDKRVLIVKGDGGRSLLQEALLARGATVDSLRCYRRGPVSYEEADLQALRSDEAPHLILISSGEGLDCLNRLLRPLEHTKLATTAVITPSPRVLEQAKESGWRDVVCASSAADDAMLASTKEWLEARFEMMPNRRRSSIER